MSASPEPDPSVIGGVPKATFALPPAPAGVFEARARRFDFLARSGNIGPYLAFLGDLSRVMAQLARDLPAPAPISSERVRQARAGQLPPIDRVAVADDPALAETLTALTDAAMMLDMPAPARLALEAMRGAGADDRRWLCENILADTVPEDSIAAHLFAAAAVQVHLARLAAGLDASALVSVGTGLCPACGGRPATSSVIATPQIENVRYASCACCATRWNEVRVKCLCCGSTKGISYRSVETADATVKAEICTECDSWMKILYQVKNPSLDPVADDVASLGLDMLMRETGLRRGGFNPFLAGY